MYPVLMLQNLASAALQGILLPPGRKIFFSVVFLYRPRPAIASIRPQACPNSRLKSDSGNSVTTKP